MVPIITPIGDALGFDRLWFAMMICINLQMSFMTPPFAYAIFYLRGAVDPALNVTMRDVIRGIIPYVVIIAIALAVFIFRPGIILWLPTHTRPDCLPVDVGVIGRGIQTLNSDGPFEGQGRVGAHARGSVHKAGSQFLGGSNAPRSRRCRGEENATPPFR